MSVANGAVIGRKVDNQNLAALKVLQRPILIVDTKQFELGCRISYLQFIESRWSNLLGASQRC